MVEVLRVSLTMLAGWKNGIWHVKHLLPLVLFCGKPGQQKHDSLINKVKTHNRRAHLAMDSIVTVNVLLQELKQSRPAVVRQVVFSDGGNELRYRLLHWLPGTTNVRSTFSHKLSTK